MELTQAQLEQIKNKSRVDFSDDDISFLYKTARTVAKHFEIHGNDKEDYVQDFVTNFVIKNIYKYDKNKSSFVTFSYNLAIYEILHFFKKQKQSNRLISSYKLDDEIILDGNFVTSKIDSIPSPSKKVLSPYYVETLKELCDKKYTNLKEYYFNNKKSETIGKENNVSRQAINQRLDKEKKKLKEDLHALGYDASDYIEKY